MRKVYKVAGRVTGTDSRAFLYDYLYLIYEPFGSGNLSGATLLRRYDAGKRIAKSITLCSGIDCMYVYAMRL